MLSIIIPVYREPYLNQTIQSLLYTAEGDIEILPVFDGEAPDEPLIADIRIRPIFLEEHKGLRGAVNAGIENSKGDWIMKCDAHCAFAQGWDTVLMRDCKENWLMTPRRYSLSPDTWTIATHRPYVDYHYLSFPGTQNPKYGYSFQIINWNRKKNKPIDDTMGLQGSCWFANKKYFMEHIYPLDDVNYDVFALEHQEIGLKYWLGGGAIKVNKNTWYAHLSKRKSHYDAGIFSVRHKKDAKAVTGSEWATRHWMNNEEPNMVHPFSWLIERFNPPGWENWEERWKQKI